LMRSGLFIELFLFRTECHPHLLYPANFAVFLSFYSRIMYCSFFIFSIQPTAHTIMRILHVLLLPSGEHR
jgi:hypothetical protein